VIQREKVGDLPSPALNLPVTIRANSIIDVPNDVMTVLLKRCELLFCKSPFTADTKRHLFKPRLL
jgi:hypothetical protein